jgi:ABC-type nitrate/sulfonate/bicarbonate transport system substrate-binding protein
MPDRGMLAALAGLVALLPLSMAAVPEPQMKGLRPVRFITFTMDAATIAAQARGLFAAEGLDLQVTITPSSTFQMQSLARGDFDIASTAFDNVLAWSGREGAEIVGVLQRGGQVNLPFYVRPEIQDWPDLRGRPLAVDAVDTAYALVLRRILLDHGLDFDRGDYELIPIGGQRAGSLASGETFAAMLSTEQEAAAAGLRRVTDHREVLPEYPDGVYAVNRTWGERNRDTVARFIRAWRAGARWATENPQAAVELIMATQGLNRTGLQGVLDLRTQFGFTLPMGTNLSRFLDDSYYQAAVGR